MTEDKLDELNNALAEAIKVADAVIKGKEEQQISSYFDSEPDHFHGLSFPHTSVDWNPLAPSSQEEGLQPPPQCLLRIKR